MKRGFICSSFDLLHAGHFLMLQECKKYCDKLVVGLHINPKLENPDKNEPVESILERQIKLLGCKYVDEIIVYETEQDLMNILHCFNLNIRFLGSEYKKKPITGKDIVQIKFIDRLHNYSSSSLRERIKKA